ncbi:uncharacterized protein Z519_03217 [Cladophialophora bantiana CBS 173.52]|uniref:UDENN domain-containing protein n=1 Tax=Cladophialophora bantiana (strain ATCC 10958 / CBS 173.52 / CDC B-1940 / NIH 8579) TaxID=1442370 RepID=A0A0D2HZ20_CLAB1|nr:uncharacterized protein Z519_03217 [Cladophialophora bantiana CBS 173.52]KIW96150.1 hypothetical protein Z519_03217 [Cladophialophora bantiana CBS 173.52]
MDGRSGPEVEFWVHSDGENLFKHNDWSLMPFMALSDGAHAMAEEFSYFTLLDSRNHDSEPTEAQSSSKANPRGTGAATSTGKGTSLFGISCTRQIRAEKLKRRSVGVTRSTVQKAVVVISPTARGMGELRERLGIVTAAWFAQEDFSDISILKEFQDSLVRAPPTHEDGKDHHFGLSLRELIHEFRHQTLALVKCLLLQRKMLFFGSKCERLCMMQFALISLIPGLIANLQDAADPSLDAYAQNVQKATSLKTSDRASLLAYMGLPLQLFGKGSMFGPYTPLQQLDILADYDTKSYVVGSTNSLLLQQKERYSDILINLDESNSITITSPSLRTALALSAADRRWIDYLTQTVLDTWDPENPSRPKNMGYAGSEDAIRMQFEEYILSLLSSMAYQIYHESLSENSIPASVANIENFPEPGDTASDFNPEFLVMWRSTNNFALFDRLTQGNRIFDIIEPRHPTGGGLTVEDLQRRVARGMADLHLDERVREGREQLGRTLQSGRERVEAGMARFWAEVEKAKEQRAQQRATKRTSRSQSVTRTSGEGERKENQDPATKQPAVALSSASSNSSWMVVEPDGDSGSKATPVSPPSSSVASTSTPAASNWTTSLRDRTPRVDTSQIQASAREGAARAGAYLSGWGTWARERMQQSQQGKGTATQTASGAGESGRGGGGAAAATGGGGGGGGGGG